MTNVLNKILFFVDNKYCDILDNACSFWLDFRQRQLMCSSNVKLLSIVTLKFFCELLLLMTEPSMFLVADWLGDKKKWHLVVLALKLFSQAHRPGSFEKRRPLSIFHGFGIHNGYLKPYNRPIFEKNSPRADFGSVLPPQWIRELKGGKIMILLQ